MMSKTVARDSTGRLHWQVPLDGVDRTVDLFPSAFGRSIGIHLNGRWAGRLRKPNEVRPIEEAIVSFGAHELRVIAIWRGPVNTLATDVLVDGRSARDGATLDQVRQSAPAPTSPYEVVSRTMVDDSEPTPHAWLWAGAPITFMLGFVWLPSPAPELRRPIAVVLAILLVLSEVGLIVLWANTRRLIVNPVDRFVRARQDWSDQRRRWVLAFGLFAWLGLGFVAIGVWFGYVWVVSLIRN